MKIFIPFLYILFSPFFVLTQISGIEWSETYGGSSWDNGQCSFPTSDAGFLIAGWSYSDNGDITFNYFANDFWIAKLDSNATIQWEKTYGGFSWDYLSDVRQTSDGGFICVGSTYSGDGDVTFNHGQSDVWVIKLNSYGDMEWQKSFGGFNLDNGKSVVECSTGGFMIAGSTSSNDGDISEVHGGGDAWVIKLDTVGGLVWEHTYGGSSADYFTKIISAKENGYLLAGYSKSNDGDVTTNHGQFDIWIAKISEEGNIEFQNSFGGSKDELTYGLVQLEDSTYIIAGHSFSSDYDVTSHHGSTDSCDIWIINISAEGILLWEKSYGGTNNDKPGKNISALDDCGVVIVGETTSTNGDISENFGGLDLWTFRLDSTGNIIWQQSVGGSEDESGNSIYSLSGGGYSVFGWTYSNDGDIVENHGFNDYWLLKYGPECITGSPDICNGLDDNCNGSIDEDAAFYIIYNDEDGDTYGNAIKDTLVCHNIPGFVSDSTDCDDTEATVNPASIEICNLEDDNCDGIIDEGFPLLIYYLDFDNDNYGTASYDSLACWNPAGYSPDSTDCDDTNPSIYPGAPEILNGLDDNCDGFIDEGLEINNALLSGIKIYPNPAIDQLFIETSLQENFEIEIFDATGRIVFNSIFNSSSNIPLLSFSSGFYFMKIISENGFAGINFVKE